MTAILNFKGVQRSFTKKVTTEQRYKGGKNARVCISRERIFQADGIATSKSWRQWPVWLETEKDDEIREVIRQTNCTKLFSHYTNLTSILN